LVFKTMSVKSYATGKKKDDKLREETIRVKVLNEWADKISSGRVHKIR